MLKLRKKSKQVVAEELPNGGVNTSNEVYVVKPNKEKLKQRKKSRDNTNYSPFELVYSRPHFLNLNKAEFERTQNTKERPIVGYPLTDSTLLEESTDLSTSGSTSSVGSQTSTSGVSISSVGNNSRIHNSGGSRRKIAGYAETINSGDAKFNEDQAIYDESFPDEGSSFLYAVFDGHGGWQCSKYAALQLPNRIAEKLTEITAIKQGEDVGDEIESNLITAAIEAAFVDLDDYTANIISGTSGLVALFTPRPASKTLFLHVANAGDCRALLTAHGEIHEMSRDHYASAPYELNRMMTIASYKPEILGDVFRNNVFVDAKSKPKVISERDIGNKIPCIDAQHTAPVLATVTTEDVQRSPIVIGEGKAGKVLGKLTVTRGFGDHNVKVKANSTELYVKPLLTPLPEVRTRTLKSQDYDELDVLILASDGFWDTITNQVAVNTVREVLKEKSNEKPEIAARTAASRLVELARVFSGDDITVFVIPIAPFFKIVNCIYM